MQAYGLFTLPETDTDTDKMGTEPNGNLHRSPSLSSVNAPRNSIKVILYGFLSRCPAV